MTTLTITYAALTPSITGGAVSGQIGTLRCAFTFSADWDNYPTRTAVFSTWDASGQVLLDENGECAVPSSLLEKPGTLTIGVFGTATDADGEILRYAGRCAVVRVEPGVSFTASEASEADASAYEQLLVRLIAVENATLPAATESTLGGVKIGEGITVSADGTISIDDSGDSGGTSAAWELISSMDASAEAVSAIEFTGLPDFREYVLCADIPRNSAGYSGVKVSINNVLLFQVGAYFVHSSQDKSVTVYLQKLPDGRFWLCGMAAMLGTPYNQDGLGNQIGASAITAVNALKFALMNTATAIPAGAAWKLYGRN